MEQDLERLLASPGLGWKILDAEGRDLLEDVQRLRSEASQAEEVRSTAANTVEEKKNQLEYLEYTLGSIQKLIDSFRHDLENTRKGEHMLLSEVQGTQQFCVMQQHTITQQNETASYLKDQIESKRKEVQKLEKSVDGDSGLLYELLERLGQLDDDNAHFLQHSAEDASAIKNLNVSLEKMSTKVWTVECELTRSKEERIAVQTAYSQLVAAFLEAAESRDNLLLQWEETLNNIQRKGTDHATVIEEIIITQEKIRKLQRRSGDESELLNQLLASYHEVEKQLNLAELEFNKAEEKALLQQKSKSELTGQLSEAKNGVSQASSEMVAAKERYKITLEFKNEKANYLKRLESLITKSEEKFSLSFEFLVSTEEAVHSLENEIQMVEKKAVALENQRDKLAELRQKNEAICQVLASQEATLRGTLSAMKGRKSCTQLQISKLENDVKKKQELIYKQEVNIRELKERLNHLMKDDNNNMVDTEEVELLQEELKKTLYSTIKTKTQNSLSKWKKEIDKMETLIQNLKMEISNMERKRKLLEKQTQDLRVETTLTELHLQNRIAKLAALSNSATETVQSKQDVEELAMEQLEAAQIRLRAADSNWRDIQVKDHELKLKTQQAETRIGQLKDKYKSICTNMDPQSDAEEISTVLVALKIAGEREGLQLSGDVLDLEVRQAEEEVTIMEEVLELVSQEERTFRSQLHNILQHNKDEEELQLESKLQNLHKEISAWEDLKTQALQDHKSTKEHLREVELQGRAVEELLREKRAHSVAVGREIADFAVKKSHATQAVGNLKWHLRNKHKLLYDIELRLGQERLKTVNSLLGEVASAHPMVADAVHLHCQNANIPPPPLIKKEIFGSKSSLGTLISSRSGESASARSISAKSQDSGSESVVLGPPKRTPSPRRSKKSPPSRKKTAKVPSSTGTMRVINFPTNEKTPPTSKRK